ncbi:MAG: thioether cross-link-forming SCIFF peptide maturase [Bacillota bacterium]
MDNQNKGQVHRFQSQGERMVLDVNSGALHVTDEVAWDIIGLDETGLVGAAVAGDRLADRHGAEAVLAAWGELDGLKREGRLWSPGPAAEEMATLTLPGAPVVHALCLNLAHDCNLACRYCFAGQGPFGGERRLMPADTARRAIDFLIAASGARRQLEIDFFGGEPLLDREVLFDVVPYAEKQAAGSGKAFRFTLTTNATPLTDEVIAFLNAHQVALVLSLDGRPAVHDGMRPMRNGRGSYEAVLDGVRRAVASRGGQDYYLRGTYTNRNLDFTEDVRHLADLGFDRLSLEPVVGLEGDDYSLGPGDLARAEAEYDRLTAYYLGRLEEGRPLIFFHFELEDQNGPCLRKRATGCGAGHEYLAVTPDGELFPCHQFVGREGFKLGDVWRGVDRLDLVRTFASSNVFTKEECRHCWARFHCGGGCNANAHLINGDIAKPFAAGCRLQKKRLECALYLQYRKAARSSR